MPSLGNVGASALVKSAASIQSQVADYEDKVRALEWNASAQTDADYQAYSKYLNTRIKNLSGTGTLSNASKALTLTSTAQSVYRSYVSNSLQRVTQDILNGNLTATDKQTRIVDLYKRAIANGDYNLAQDLYSQYQTLNQQIQYDQVQAGIAATALEKTNATAIEKGYTDAASLIQRELSTLSEGFKEAGQAPLTGELSIASKKIIDTIKTLNKSLPKEQQIIIPKGSQLNNGSLIEGAIRTIGTLYGMASDVAAATPDQSDKAQSLNDRAYGYLSGMTSIQAMGTSFTLQEAIEYAKNPDSMMTVDTKEGAKLVPRAVNNISFDAQGNVIKNYSTDVGVSSNASITNISLTNSNPLGQIEGKKVRDDTQKQLEAMGFSVDINAETGEITVMPSNQAKNSMFNDAVKQYGLSNTESYKVLQTPNGFTFMRRNDTPITTKTGSSVILQLERDVNGVYGLYGTTIGKLGSPLKSLLGSQPNFIPTPMTAQGQPFNQSAGYNPYGFGVISPPINKAIADKNAAKSFAAATAAPKVATGSSKNILAAKPVLGVPNSIPSIPNTFTSAPSTNLKTLPKYSTALNNALAGYFNNYSKQPAFYTENTVLKAIANQFYNGDVSKASAPVYQYRKLNFGS